MKKFISGFLVGAITLGVVSISHAKVFDSEAIEEAKRSQTYVYGGTVRDTADLDEMQLIILEKIYSKMKSIDERLQVMENNHDIK